MEAMITAAARAWYGSTDVDSLCLAENRLNNGDSPFSFDSWQCLEYTWEELVEVRCRNGGLSQYEAEQSAAQELGFENKAALKRVIQEMKALL
jgi:hypothetical protein